MPGAVVRRESRSNMAESPKSTARFPKILQVLRCTGGKLLPNLTVTLPSNMAFRMSNYYKLLAAQRRRRELGRERLEVPKQKPVVVGWLNDVAPEPEAKRPRRGKMASAEKCEVAWQAKDIVKAVRLLIPKHHHHNGLKRFTFDDEEEMRRVFTLLYDVFRYKTILKDALDETGFTGRHPEYVDLSAVTWLLFYDLYKRRFLPREHKDESVCKQALQDMSLPILEDQLWKYRVRLAAALARSRIKHNALELNHLLPRHLRDERLLSVEQAPVTAWVNTFLTSKAEIMEKFNLLGIPIRGADSEEVSVSKFDHVCPKVVAMPSHVRAEVARSDLVRDGHLILQDRAFFLGACFLAKILEDQSLRGTVAQTHVISPRATAYLANVLLDNVKIEKVLAFGMGTRVEEYQEYLDKVGVERCELRAEKLSDVEPDAEFLENVVAVLATPPTSWTGVADPVDLVCSRNGDMGMLMALTQTRKGRDPVLLEEQSTTLRYCMSLPQVQVVIYESHSMNPEENSVMVQSSVECMNEWARQKHAEEMRRQLELEEAEEKQNKALLPGGTPAQRLEREREMAEAHEAALTPAEVTVPACDLFEIVAVPEICSHGTGCVEEDGCYIARIQRKEVVGLDEKYMIKMAEARGLFGSEATQKKNPSTARAQKKKEEMLRAQEEAERFKPRKKIEIDRIAAPTHASLNRCFSMGNLPCERFNSHFRDCRQRQTDFRRSLIRTWWQQTLLFLRQFIPYWQLSPRARAVCPEPILELQRSLSRRPFPIRTVHLPMDTKSEPGFAVKRTELDLRRNSC